MRKVCAHIKMGKRLESYPQSTAQYNPISKIPGFYCRLDLFVGAGWTQLGDFHFSLFPTHSFIGIKTRDSLCIVDM